MSDQQPRPELESEEFQQIFAEQITPIMRSVVQLCRRMGLPDDDAQDVAQESLLRLVENWTHLTSVEPSNLNAYLLTVARRIAMQRARAKRRKTEFLADDLLLTASLERDFMVADLANHEETAALQDALSRLPNRSAAIVIMRVVYDMPSRSIAEQLHLSVPTVQVIYSRALRELREALIDDPLRNIGDVVGRSGSTAVLERTEVDIAAQAAMEFWGESVGSTWLRSRNAFLDGARPIDVAELDGAGRVLEALEAEAAGAYA